MSNFQNVSKNHCLDQKVFFEEKLDFNDDQCAAKNQMYMHSFLEEAKLSPIYGGVATLGEELHLERAPPSSKERRQQLAGLSFPRI